MTRRSAALSLSLPLVSFLLPAAARGQQDPFSLSASSASGPPQQVTVGSSSVLGLVEDVIRSQNQFAPLQGQAVNASLNYGGIPNAIQFQRNAAGTSATVTIPSTGFTRTFTGANERDVNEQIRDFLIKEGASEYARFLRTVNEQSVVGVVDGNPQAATAVLSNSAFYKFGLNRSPLTAGALVSSTGFGSGLRLDVTGGFVDTDVADGIYVTGALSSVTRLGDRVGISFASPFMYREVGDAKVYMGGLEIGVPIVILKPFVGKGIVWQVTPDVVGAAAGSVDMAAGGLFFGYGGTSSLSIPIGDSAALTMGNGIYFYHGYPLDIGDYHFDTDLDQQVMKHGLKLTQALGPVSVDIGMTYTAFLQEAALDHYWSPSVGVVLGLGTLGVRVSYQGDFADHYTAHGGNEAVYLNY
jgi:hypothetical protein